MALRDELKYLAYSQYYAWKSYFVYRFQAVVSLLSAAVGIATNIISLTVIYSISTGIPGWSYYQLLFLSVLASMTFMTITYFNYYNIPRLLREGNLDPFFTKPIGLISLIVSPLNSALSPIPSFTALVILIVIMGQLQAPITALLPFMLLYAMGLLALSLFATMIAVLSYRLIKSATFINRMANMLSGASRYPLPIYGYMVQVFLSLGIPVGLAVYYPAQTLLGRISINAFVALLLLELTIIFVSRKAIYWLMRGYSGGGG